jgi:hypothetical protein
MKILVIDDKQKNLDQVSQNDKEKENIEIQRMLKEESFIPERTKKILKDKILFIEDTEQEIKNIEELVGEDIKVSSSLSSALEMLEKNKSAQHVLTDLFYPIGNIKNELKDDFCKRLAKGLKDATKFGQIGHQETINKIYSYIEDVSEQKAEEYPSGILLALYCLLEDSRLPRIVTSLNHHNFKVEPINQFLQKSRLGFSSNATSLFQFVDSYNSSKNWKAAIKGALFSEEKRVVTPPNELGEQFFYKNEKLFKEEHNKMIQNLRNNQDFMNSELVKLALELKRYF